MVSSHLLLLIHVGHVSIDASHTLVQARSVADCAPCEPGCSELTSTLVARLESALAHLEEREARESDYSNASPRRSTRKLSEVPGRGSGQMDGADDEMANRGGSSWSFDRIGGRTWQLLEAMNERLSSMDDYVAETLEMASNFLYVLAVVIGFWFLPRNFMLISGGLAIFGPLALFGALLGIAQCVSALLIYFAVSAGELDKAPAVVLARGMLDTVMLFAPWCVSTALQLFSSACLLAATSPTLALLLVWLFFFLSSTLFQHAALALGWDADGDGRFGWRDVWVRTVAWLKEHVPRPHSNDVHGDEGHGTSHDVYGLDELYASARRRLRESRLEVDPDGGEARMERLEGMLVAIGAPDLRERQRTSKLGVGLMNSMSQMLQQGMSRASGLVESVVATVEQVKETVVEATSRGKPAPPAIAAPPGHTYATLET